MHGGLTLATPSSHYNPNYFYASALSATPKEFLKCSNVSH